LYNKSKTTKEKSQEMLSALNIERVYLENVLYGIESSKSVSELADIKIELGVLENNNKKQEKPTVEKLQIQGFDVFIGKNNKQNDYIVSKLAKDEDYWFHTRLCAGSHVLLKTNGIEPSEEVLFECCKLARKYSSAAQPSKVGVIFTLAKNLRKPPSAPLGYVTYKNEKEVLV
jgi:predicted ribosome quality control (RQC) complex YloA/Tae2 family protein